MQIILQLNFAARCPSKTCPGEGFVGKDCKCWCDGTAKPGLQRIVECDGDETTGTPSTVKPLSGNLDG